MEKQEDWDIMHRALLAIAGGSSFHPRDMQRCVTVVREIARNAIVAVDGELPKWLANVPICPDAREAEIQEKVEMLIARDEVENPATNRRCETCLDHGACPMEEQYSASHCYGQSCWKRGQIENS